MSVQELFTEDLAVASIDAPIATFLTLAVAVGYAAKGAVDRDALRSALRSLLIGLRVRH